MKNPFPENCGHALSRIVVIGLAAFLVCAAIGVATLRMADQPISVTGGKPFVPRTILNAPLFKQADPRWAQDGIGGSGEKMEKAGCTVSCVAMLFSHYGIESTPGHLNAYLKKYGGYTSRGWLRWEKCVEYAAGQARLVYVGNPDHLMIDTHLAAGNPVIVKVFLPGGIPHWVLVVGKDGAEYWVNDPLGPEEGPIPLSRFGDKIHSLRVFTKS